MLLDTQADHSANVPWRVTGRRRQLQRALSARRRAARGRACPWLPDEMPIFADGTITLYTSASHAETLEWTVTDRRRLSEYIRAHLRRNASEDGVLQITCEGTQFAPLPVRNGRVLRVHLGADVAAGLVRLQAALANALVHAEST